LIDEYAACSYHVLPCNVPNGTVHQRLRKSNEIQLTSMLHTDGAPVTKVGDKSVWSIQATIVEIPPSVRDHVSVVMVFGAWLCGSPSDRDLFWIDFVEQLRELCNDGITLQLDHQSKVQFNVRVQLVTFDLPAMVPSPSM
jgi:hypothetical protein